VAAQPERVAVFDRPSGVVQPQSDRDFRGVSDPGGELVGV
jgi:hypothetical protein